MPSTFCDTTCDLITHYVATRVLIDGMVVINLGDIGANALLLSKPNFARKRRNSSLIERTSSLPRPELSIAPLIFVD